MSTIRSLVPALEASVRLVKAKRWNAILEEAAQDVFAALAEEDRYRHSSAPTAAKKVRDTLRDYFMLAEQARKELRDV